MAIAFVSQSSNGGTGVTSVIVTAPTSIVNNNYLILVATRRGGGGTITAPAGFTLVASGSRGSILTEMHYKKCASESGDYTITLSASGTLNVGIAQYSGVDTTTPLDGTATVNTSNDSTLTGTGLTVSGSDSMLLFGIGFGSGVSLTQAGSMTRRIDQSTGAANDSAVGLNEQLLSASGATGNRTISMGFNDDYVAIMAALKAAAAGAASLPPIRRLRSFRGLIVR